jgi:D-serine deaminase-like pyridoxal phosphate-dependent protein
MEAIDLDTPALYVDLDVLERNIAGMQEQCRTWGVGGARMKRTYIDL